MGLVIPMVPVATVQVGCTVTLAVGAAGDEGAGFTVTEVFRDTQLLASLAVTVYAAGLTPLKVPEV